MFGLGEIIARNEEATSKAGAASPERIDLALSLLPFVEVADAALNRASFLSTVAHRLSLAVDTGAEG